MQIWKKYTLSTNCTRARADLPSSAVMAGVITSGSAMDKVGVDIKWGLDYTPYHYSRYPH